MEKNILRNRGDIMLKENGFKVFTEEEASSRKITSERIKDLFGTCLLRESDFENEELMCDYRMGEGLNGMTAFNVDRLNECRPELFQYMSQIAELDHAPSFELLGKTTDGGVWAESREDIDMLLKLGTACNMLYIRFPKELWPYLPGGGPSVCKQLYSEKDKLYGFKGKTYIK